MVRGLKDRKDLIFTYKLSKFVDRGASVEAFEGNRQLTLLTEILQNESPSFSLEEEFLVESSFTQFKDP